MGKYMRESGRIRAQEKSFNFEMGGDPDPKHAIGCTHGWYHEQRIGSKRREQCVKCGMPKEPAELEVQAREEARQAAIRRAQEFQPICEFCFRDMPRPMPEGWDFVWQSYVCPECRKHVERDGGYGIVVGGAYADRPDPRAK